MSNYLKWGSYDVAYGGGTDMMMSAASAYSYYGYYYGFPAVMTGLDAASMNYRGWESKVTYSTGYSIYGIDYGVFKYETFAWDINAWTNCHYAPSSYENQEYSYVLYTNSTNGPVAFYVLAVSVGGAGGSAPTSARSPRYSGGGGGASSTTETHLVIVPPGSSVRITGTAIQSVYQAPEILIDGLWYRWYDGPTRSMLGVYPAAGGAGATFNGGTGYRNGGHGATSSPARESATLDTATMSISGASVDAGSVNIYGVYAPYYAIPGGGGTSFETATQAYPRPTGGGGGAVFLPQTTVGVWAGKLPGHRDYINTNSLSGGQTGAYISPGNTIYPAGQLSGRETGLVNQYMAHGAGYGGGATAKIDSIREYIAAAGRLPGVFTKDLAYYFLFCTPTITWPNYNGPWCAS